MPDVPWYENDALFREQVTAGHRWERYVAAFLALQGLEVRLSEQSVRDHIKNAHHYKGGVDLWVAGILAEVKSRGFAYHTPRDFGHETLLVDTVPKWELKNPEPVLVLCVSQRTGAMIATSSSVKDHWEKVVKYDNVRGIEELFYIAHRKVWLPIEKVVANLEGGWDPDRFLADCKEYHHREWSGFAVEDPAVSAL